MKLSRLIQSMETVSVSESGNPEITSICYRSQDAGPGALFVAIKGVHTDGHQYIRDAIGRGAAAIVKAADQPVSVSDASVVCVKDTRKALAAIASAFYDHPSEKLYLIGITGTNGKTTTAYLIEHLLKAQGKNVGVIGTINYRYQGRVFANPLTTPESLDLQKILAEMASAGVTYGVVEVSSHGVALDRISHCWFDMGVYTNLSQDHLDFHGTMADYWACKRRFFTEYLCAGPKKGQALAIVNTDNPRGRELYDDLSGCRKINVGTHETGDVFPSHVHLDQYGIRGELRIAGQTTPFRSPLIGHYNLENILCAAGVGLGLGVGAPEIAKAMASFGSVPGRLEPVFDASGRHVFVDYAHTPDALENVLSTLKKIIPGRLICVFGCGGDRDRKKRSLMGEIAARWSDLVVITSDNPRTEAPNAIIDQIRPGVEQGLPRRYSASEIKAGFSEKGYVVEPDRETAIHTGIRISKPGDTVLIAGKGHEDYQILGTTKIHFDDRETAAAALDKILRN